MMFYCVKCRKKVNVPDGQVEYVTLKNGRRAARATCPNCGTRMFKILGA